MCARRMTDSASDSEPLAPALYLVSTPIGNLGDITVRALAVLRGVEVLYCEDTRVTRRLTQRYGITVPLRVYHDHSGVKAREGLVARVAGGAAVGLVSDAGTPLIADPGYKVVAACRERGLPVVSIPGASAVLPAVQLAGGGEGFRFWGFPPDRQSGFRSWLERLDSEGVHVVYLSPHKAAWQIEALAVRWPERRAVLCRELTKFYESVVTESLAGLAQGLAEGRVVLRGELVLVLLGGGEAPCDGVVDDMLEVLRAAGWSLRDASDRISRWTGVGRRAVYRRGLPD